MLWRRANAKNVQICNGSYLCPVKNHVFYLPANETKLTLEEIFPDS